MSVSVSLYKTEEESHKLENNTYVMSLDSDQEDELDVFFASFEEKGVKEGYATSEKLRMNIDRYNKGFVNFCTKSFDFSELYAVLGKEPTQNFFVKIEDK